MHHIKLAAPVAAACAALGCATTHIFWTAIAGGYGPSAVGRAHRCS